MKKGKQIFSLIGASLLIYACHKEPIGFLMTEYAGYAPDSMLVKSKLDTSYTIVENPWYKLGISFGFTEQELKQKGIFPTEKKINNRIEYLRYQNNTPWASVNIQGLKGTSPIKVEISDVKPHSLDAVKLKSILQVRGSSGSIILPMNHGISPGKYALSLRFSNEGWVKERSDVFHIVIE